MLRKPPGPATTPTGAAATVAFIAGGILIIWLSYIHFHLWQSVGYRRIPTIGPLFLVQSIAGLLIGLLTMAVRRAWTAVLGAGFAVATLAGFLISVGVGLFGFKDSWSAPDAHLAVLVELVALAVFVFAGVLCLVGRQAGEPTLTGSPQPASMQGQIGARGPAASMGPLGRTEPPAGSTVTPSPKGG
jgi:hypothetical protein